ncbi:FkbM family methyltransferase [Loktanella sp. S4079]|uniref:FkbM family methyltransferase n=1 Tax=Loktanella sp. S4079 TaxID=579483 RepID=UPI0006991199|nr:FkbM family methyltransferase [Loktanella sp. S4079]
MTAPLPNIASLWIGKRLSFLEILCLKSFADAGHHVTLYTYGELENPPEFCEIRDAREIWDNDKIIIHHQRQSPAIHSDIWRLKLMQKSDAIWVDTDAYCLRPFTVTNGYLVGLQDKRGVANGVLRLPKDSPALRAFDDFLSTPGTLPPWWRPKDKDAFAATGLTPDFGNFKWGTTGPAGLNHFMKQSSEIEHALPPHVLYPLPQTRKSVPLRSPSIAESFIKDDTISVHFYATGFRKHIASGTIPPESYLAHLAEKHGISAPTAPSPVVKTAEVGLPKQADKKWQRRNRRIAQRLVFDILARARSENGGRLKYVQVGANDGRLADPLFAHAKDHNFDGLLIEPSPIYYESLTQLYGQQPHIETLNVGVAEERGTLTLHQLHPLHQGSFPNWARGCASMHRDVLVRSLSAVGDVNDEMILSVDVPVDRLDRILEAHDALSADILIIDVEGYEANIFRSFSLKSFRPIVIMFEFTQITDADATEIHANLARNGYRMYPMNNDVIAIRNDWLPQSIVDTFALLSIAEWE